MANQPPSMEQVRRVTALVNFVMGFLEQHATSDEEQIAVGMAVCQYVFDRKGIQTDRAVQEFADGLRTMRALNANQLN